jgi:MOSC domain-containing protein YiiM
MSNPRIRVLAVNAARPRRITLGGRTMETGIYKHPVAGRVAIARDGVTGDTVADVKHHGGPDQAVYLYSAADATWWAQELSRDIPPGYFGENLTLSEWWPAPRVGDRVRMGTAEIELTAPRIPCGTLATRVGDPQFVKRFAAAARSGAYARVLTPGEVSAGDDCEVVRGSREFPAIEDLFRLWYAESRDEVVVRACLAAPVAERLRATCERWLAS